jgi:hypothetical protein
MPYDDKDAKTRVERGKALEAKVLGIMRERHGWDIQSATQSEDVFEKKDAHVRMPGVDKTFTTQVKVRDTGYQIIIDFLDPCDNPGKPRSIKPDELFRLGEHTRNGRDMVCECDLYLCAPADLSCVYAVVGTRVREIANEVVQEWVEGGEELFPNNRFLNRPGKPFTSKKYNGSQLRYHIDANGRKPKLIVFVSPAAVGKQFIKVYDTGIVPKYKE